MSAIEDRLEILELLSRYAFAVDGTDPQAVADCFARDGVWVSPFLGNVRGRDAILILNQERVAKIDSAPGKFRRHFIINPIVDLDGDRANVRAYLLGTYTVNNKIGVHLTGEYRAVVVREDGDWRFAERDVIADSTEAGWR